MYADYVSIYVAATSGLDDNQHLRDSYPFLCFLWGLAGQDWGSCRSVRGALPVSTGGLAGQCVGVLPVSVGCLAGQCGGSCQSVWGVLPVSVWGVLPVSTGGSCRSHGSTHPQTIYW